MKALQKIDPGPRPGNSGDQRDVRPSSSLGSEIRELRKARGLTLKDMSHTTGISLSYLSAIERDSGNPSLDVITSIAEALAVDVNWFFTPRRGAGPLERAHIVRAESRRNLNLLYGTPVREIGYSDSLLSSSIGGRFYMGMAVYAPGAEGADEPMHMHEGEEHGVVVKGQLEMTLGDEVITLMPGDSYSFDARIRHRGRNRTREEAVLIWAVSPVVLPKEVEQPSDKLRRKVPIKAERRTRRSTS